MRRILLCIASGGMASMSDLLQTIAFVVVVLLILFLFFIFHGDPDIWDLAHKTVMRKLQ